MCLLTMPVSITTAQWWIYILRCKDNTLYTGITTDIERRLAEHNTDDSLAAKYTRSRRPLHLLYQEAANSRAEASRRELEIKRLSKAAKEKLISPHGD